MDRMHEELLRLEGRHTSPPTPLEDIRKAGSEAIPSANGVEAGGEGEEEEWETVGPKNKTAVTRTHALIESGLSDIFGGQLRSVVKSKGGAGGGGLEGKGWGTFYTIIVV